MWWGWVNRLPRWGWALAAGVLLLLGGLRWHGGVVRQVRADAMAAQAALDRAAFGAAQAQAAAAQAAAVRAAAARAEQASRVVADELAGQLDDLGRRHADLRLRWARANAGAGGAGPGGADGAAAPAAGFDAAACAARGWVDFDTASTIAEAADRATAKDDAWIAWMSAQGAVWPE